MGLVELDRLPFCAGPFDSGTQLCKTCRYRTQERGFRRCARVVAESPVMRELLRRAAPVAATDSPVIITGESGTGKEVLARALHANSPRADKLFLAVNVAALPGELVESELFGHVRGAFTGALESKRGLFEAADGGTLLLDEIADMALPLQAKLLRVLQDGEARRVGSVQPSLVDVRILCATNQDLSLRVAQGRFREDLYYRLSAFILTVPPLRARSGDLLRFVRLFLKEGGHHTGRLTPQAQSALASYQWPGNVRQLANAIKHAIAYSGGAPIEVAHLPVEVVNPRRFPLGRESFRTLAEVEREHVLRVLDACEGRPADAARILGIGRSTLWRKLRAAQAEAGGEGRGSSSHEGGSFRAAR